MPVPDTLAPISHFAFLKESSGVWKVEFRDIQGIPLFSVSERVCFVCRM